MKTFAPELSALIIFAIYRAGVSTRRSEGRRDRRHHQSRFRMFAVDGRNCGMAPASISCWRGVCPQAVDAGVVQTHASLEET
jgi:hypothetical protein